MENTELVNKKLRKQAVELLGQCEIVTLASIDRNGCPRPVPLSKIKADGFTTIWFATGTSSEKTQHFKANPKAGISFYKEGDSVTLTGEVEIISDMTVKQELWADWFYAHFPKGVQDPEYCILKFTAKQATYWLKQVFVKEQL